MYSARKPFLRLSLRKDNGVRKAYSLIELLVVVALIALLIGMLIPSVQRSMRLASATVCMYNLREIGHSLTLYRIENDGWLPNVRRPESSNLRGAERPEVWFLKLFPSYLRNPEVLTCPEDPYRFRLLKHTGRIDSPVVGDYASYGINSFIMTAGGGFLADLDRRRPTRPLDTILIADLGPDHVSSASPVIDAPMGGPARNTGLLLWDDGFDPFSGAPHNPWLTTRHSNGINVLTIDGGVREASTTVALRRPIRGYYRNCARSGCTLCRYFHLYHYSFAEDRLFWWTGSRLKE